MTLPLTRILSGAGALALGLWAIGCDDKPTGKAPPPSSAKPAPAASTSASAAQVQPQAPWYVGSWSGTYEAKHYLIEMEKKQGGVGAWAKDEGQLGSGSGKLELTIDDQRVVSGSCTGPLGALTASGELDEEKLRVRLTPKEPAAQDSFAGLVLAQKKGDGFEGKLRASTGDSLTVREAPVKLTKAK